MDNCTNATSSEHSTRKLDPESLKKAIYQAMLDHKGKFAATYKRSYVVKKAFSRGGLILADMGGHDFNMPTNSNAVVWYFAWRSLLVHLISTFWCQKKKKKKRERENKQKKM